MKCRDYCQIEPQPHTSVSVDSEGKEVGTAPDTCSGSIAADSTKEVSCRLTSGGLRTFRLAGRSVYEGGYGGGRDGEHQLSCTGSCSLP